MRNERIYCTLKPDSNYTYCHEEMKIKTRVHIRQATSGKSPADALPQALWHGLPFSVCPTLS